MAELGHNIMIYAGEGETTPALIGGTRSNSIEADADLIEKAGAQQHEWKEYVAGRKSWQVSTSFIVLSAGYLNDYESILRIGKTFTLEWRKRQSEEQGVNATSPVMVTGKAILKTAKYDAPEGSLVQGSFQFVGTGPLLEEEEEEENA